MGDSAGKIYLDLVVRSNIKAQVQQAAAAAQQAMQQKLDAVGQSAGAAMGQALDKGFSKSLEKAKSRVASLEAEFDSLGASLDAMRQNALGLFNGVRDPGDAAQKYIESTRAYQELIRQQEAVRAKLDAAQENLRIEQQAAAAKAAQVQERAQQKAAAAAERAAERQRAAQERAAAAAEKAAQRQQAAAAKAAAAAERAAQREQAAAEKAAAAQKRESERAAAAAQRAQEKAALQSQKNWQNATKGIQRLFRTIGGALKATFLTAGLYAFFRAFKTLMTDAAEDNAQFTKSLAQVKANLATAFTPIMQAIMPALNSLMAGLASATRSIASFIAGVFGTTYAKASAAAKKLQTVSSGAKKAAGQLASFDKLNVLQQNEDSGEAASGADFDQGEGDKQAQSLGERFKTLLDRWLKPLQAITFDNLIGAFDRLVKAGQALGTTAFAGLEWAYFNLFVPLSKWTIEDYLPTYLDTLASAASFLNTTLLAFAPAAQSLWDNFLQPIAEWTGGLILDVLAQLKISFDELTLWVSDNSGRIQECFDKVGEALNLVWVHVMRPVLEGAKTFVLGWINTFTQNLQGMADSILTILGGVADFIAGVFTGNWERAFKGLGNVAIGVANAIITGFESMVNRAIDAVNGLIAAAAKLPVVGDAIGNFQIPAMRLPRIPALASGGVIDQPTLAMMGEYQGAGRDPEIAAPESKLRAIFSEQLAPLVDALYELIAYLREGGDREIIIRFAGSLAELVRLLKPYIDKEDTRVGAKLISGGVY